MNRDYVEEQITEIIFQISDLWYQVHELSEEMQFYGYDDVCKDLDLYSIRIALNQMCVNLLQNHRRALNRYFPVKPDPDRLREDAEA